MKMLAILSVIAFAGTAMAQEDTCPPTLDIRKWFREATMVVRSTMLLVLGLLTAACSGSRAGEDGGNHDGSSQDAADAGDGDFAVIECTPSVDKCPQELECLCCGSIGPREQCLCTTVCYNDQECTRQDYPACNQRDSSSPGVCTPESYVCCWDCQ